MLGDAPETGHSERNSTADPFAEARRKLFADWPLRNKSLEQAADALAEDRADIAGPLVSKFLEKRPNDPRALNLLADIARRAGRFEEAERLTSRCIEQSPACAGYRFNYAVILRRLRKFGPALEQLDLLLAEEPRNPLYRDQKAAVLGAMGNLADAIAMRQDLFEGYPPSPEGWLDYGDLLRSAGFQDQCIAAYRKALALAPSLSNAYSRLAVLKTYKFVATEITGMEAQLAVPGLSADHRANLHFALGKAYGDEKRYAESFDNFAKGNALRRIGVEFDTERLTAHRLHCRSLFTREFFREREGWGCDSRAPIFIVGLPRSGSTLLEQILSSHSAIEGLEELAELDMTVGKWLCHIEGQGHPNEFQIGGWFDFKSKLVKSFPQAVSSADAGTCRALGEEYIALTQRRRKLGRPVFTDKALRNFGYVGLIHLILPNARIIDIRRYPLDCGWSCFKSHFPGGQPFSYRLADIGRHYANYVALMAHFDRVLPGRVHRVIYEDLVANPETEVRRLFDYLGLPFEEQCLRFHENKRAVNTLSSEQVRMPLYKSGVAQWEPYEAWLGPLKAALGPVLEFYPQAPGLSDIEVI